MGTRFDLTGKVVVVTGGSRGLGLAMAGAFAQHGADVVIASRKHDTCETVAVELRRRFGHSAQTNRQVRTAYTPTGLWSPAGRNLEPISPRVTCR